MHPKDVLGRDGEEAAARYLIDAGLVILDRNFRCGAGELDIVARDGDQLVFVEVKARRSTAFGPPVAAVTPRKVRRVRAAAAAWLRARGPHRGDLRFDVVSVRYPPGVEPVVEHLRAAF